MNPLAIGNPFYVGIDAPQFGASAFSQQSAIQNTITTQGSSPAPGLAANPMPGSSAFASKITGPAPAAVTTGAVASSTTNPIVAAPPPAESHWLAWTTGAVVVVGIGALLISRSRKRSRR